MSSVTVPTWKGTSRTLEEYAIECPFCHALVNPRYIFLHGQSLFAVCPNSDCNQHFILTSDYTGTRFEVVEPNSTPGKREFSNTIRNVSPDFETIYNQAYHAEQIHLDQICGVGYRKALEFLIKDYLISHVVETDADKVVIKKSFLDKCIQDYVPNEQVKIVARRAVWLGNDETHYTRKWENKDVSHLKRLIDLTVRWIESDIETKELLQDMPEPIK